MFVFDWIKEKISSLLTALNIMPENSTVIFLGLDYAGKTTLMHILRDGTISAHTPTVHPTNEELLIGSLRFKAQDMGGHQVARRLWKDYFVGADAAIFLVDAADRNRMAEAKEELQKLFDSPELRGVPIAVFGNKIDIPTAVSEDELRHFLGVPTPVPYGHNKQSYAERPNGGGPIEVFMVSLLKRMGYAEAFKWLADMIKERKKRGKEM